MGKSRRNRGAHRRDPIAKKAVKPPTDPELAALRESKILPIVKDLQNADPKQRSTAASAISSIIQDSRCRKLLLREQIVHIVLTQTLTDAALESRAAGWGILQVLALEEEADFCLHLYRQDILSAMEFASKMVSDKLSSKDPVPAAEKSLLVSITSSIISLSSALAEARDEILEAVANNAAITSLLFSIVVHGNSDEGLAALRMDAMACVMVLSEDNEKLAGHIVAQHQPLYETLQVARKDPSGEGVLACGIIHNIFVSLQGQTLDHNILDDAEIIPTLSKTISTITPASSSTTNGHGEGWAKPFEYQSLALEIIASIGTSLNSATDEPAPDSKRSGPADDEEGDDEDMGDVVDDADPDDSTADPPEVSEEMDDDEMHADMDMVTGADDDDAQAGSIDDVPALKALLAHALPELARVASLPPSDQDTLRLQALALAALNNIAWSVSLIDFVDEHNAGIQSAWRPAGRAIWQSVISPILASDTADVELATQVTSLAWAVVRTLGADTPLQADEHRKFITLYQATRTSPNMGAAPEADPFQALGVKCVGVLGQLAMHPAPVALNREVGTFLMTILSSLPDAPAADAVEALNQIFDMYGDESYECDREVFWKDNYLKHLEDILPKAKAMVKGVDKRSQGELRARADEAVTNLTRFLAYKRKHKPQ
ncbi:uncharacterized protein F5Z01DRAFT_637486 [Emericellopsis atlantica]|uniref:SYO1-like TPR repeats domain-containing protein n=1 Tax=Emericellopsis atlantica TaxID=2614577 RepID=A0A9P8CMZ3_9HYPO|nr:uncharacterized protein F5Z01DRAFT_637486 [Emericellopsis atlantica]KAG9253229.1 hypothetical protein F5Z01DRAFT_637486 [Emericellopsis atlantica]